jgi:hypothetical protein
MDPREKFKDVPATEGFSLRYVDDGDPYVYIRSDWLNLFALAILFVWIGVMLGRHIGR